MNSDFFLSVLPLAISLAIPAAIFFARNWLLTWISRSVQHRFDVRIEDLRAELRKSEEELKSDLRDKEAEIAALRSNVLSGSANRQSLLDKRRFEAIERVWTAVNDLGKHKLIARMMASVNFKVAAAHSSDPKVRKFFETIDEAASAPMEIKDVARDEEPFLTELSWALFSAYKMIVSGSYARLQVLKLGIEDPEKLLTNEATKKILKAALPHQSKFIDEQEPETYFYLLEEIERSLLGELRKMIEGKDAGKAAAAQAKEIMDEIKKVNEERDRIHGGDSVPRR